LLTATSTAAGEPRGAPAFRSEDRPQCREGKPVRHLTVAIALGAWALVFWTGSARADGVGEPTAVKSEDGKFFDKDGDPTYKILQDGTVDWYTYSGFRRYHSDCHVCHGPAGDGSSFAPALKDSLKRISFSDFLGIVASGRKNVTTSQDNVMPAFGSNPNVMCYIEDIYIYLRARANDAVGRVRPEKHEDRPEAFAKAEAACMGK
jgi:methanol metabolism-related c-type cytochrome